MNVLFWKLDSEKDPNYCNLYCRITIDKKRAEFATGIQIAKKDWGGSKILITARNSKAQQQNNKLKAIEYGLNEILADLQRRSKKITARRVKEIFLGEDEKKDAQFDLLENLIQAYMSAKEKEVGIFITKATINTYGRYQNNVKKWIDSCQKEVFAEECTKLVINDMIYYLRHELKHQSNAYINKHLDLLRATMIFGIDNDIIQKNPLKGLEDLPEAPPEIVYLDEDEFRRIQELENLPKSLERCRDILFFCCETGVHHGDYSRLPQIGLIEKDNDGDSWLVTNREKTKIGFDVPLSSLALKLIEKYKSLEHLPKLSLARHNDYLKVLGLRASVEKNMTSKIGRKTFADTKLNRENYSMDNTATMLGLASINYLKHYVKISRQRIKNERDKNLQKES